MKLLPGEFIIYYCTTNYLKHRSLKWPTFTILYSFWGSEIQVRLNWVFVAQSLSWVYGWDVGWGWRMHVQTHSCGCWQERFVSYQMTLFMWSLTWHGSWLPTELREQVSTQDVHGAKSPPLGWVLDLVILPKKKILKGKKSNYLVENYSRYYLTARVQRVPICLEGGKWNIGAETWWSL